MSANLENKKVVVAEIVEKFKSAESMVVVSFNGLTVEQVTELRKQCRENNVHYCVLKNRLVARALNELNIEGLDSLLEGPNEFVFGYKDVTAKSCAELWWAAWSPPFPLWSPSSTKSPKRRARPDQTCGLRAA